jgi:hypothetical protein
MASQNINVGTNADDGTGESLRSAFIDIRKMFAEVYNQTYTSDTQDLSGATFDLYSKPDLTLVGNVLTLTKPDATTDTVDLSPYLDEDATAVASATLSGNTITFTRLDSSTFDLDVSTLLGDITSIAAGDGLTGDATSGDTTLAVGGGTGITVSADSIATNDSEIVHDNLSGFVSNEHIDHSSVSITAGSGLTGGGDLTATRDLAVNVDDSTIEVSSDTVQVKANGIDHDQLANRYTVEVTKTDTSGTGGSAVTLDWSTGAIFHFSSSLTGAIELKFDEYKANQVIDIYGLTGSQTVTLNSTASGTEVFKRIGTQEYDGTADNHIQVICLDDSASTPVFHFAIGTTTATATA